MEPLTNRPDSTSDSRFLDLYHRSQRPTTPGIRQNWAKLQLRHPPTQTTTHGGGSNSRESKPARLRRFCTVWLTATEYFASVLASFLCAFGCWSRSHSLSMASLKGDIGAQGRTCQSGMRYSMNELFVRGVLHYGLCCDGKYASERRDSSRAVTTKSPSDGTYVPSGGDFRNRWTPTNGLGV